MGYGTGKSSEKGLNNTETNYEVHNFGKLVFKFGGGVAIRSEANSAVSKLESERTQTQ